MKTPISPKVLWPVIIGLVLSSLLTNINLITPDMLNFLGPWKFFVLQAVTTLLGGLAGFMAIDPARKVAESPQNADGSYKVTNLPDPAPETKFPAASVAAALDRFTPPAPAAQATVEPVYIAPPATSEVPVPTV